MQKEKKATTNAVSFSFRAGTLNFKPLSHSPVNSICAYRGFGYKMCSAFLVQQVERETRMLPPFKKGGKYSAFLVQLVERETRMRNHACMISHSAKDIPPSQETHQHTINEKNNRLKCFLGKTTISVYNTTECVEILKARFLKRACLKQKYHWSNFFWHLRLYKYEKYNPDLIQLMNAWFHSSNFYNDLNNFRNKSNINNRLLFTIIVPKKKSSQEVSDSKPETFLKPSYKTPWISDYQTTLKQNYLKSKTSTPDKYENLSWHRIYDLFPNKISIQDTQQCLELLKIRVCNLVLKKNFNPIENNWGKIQFHLCISNYSFENPQLSTALKSWYNSSLFKTDYTKFVKQYPNPDSHPKFYFKINVKPKKQETKRIVQTIKEFIFKSLSNGCWDPNFLGPPIIWPPPFKWGGHIIGGPYNEGIFFYNL